MFTMKIGLFTETFLPQVNGVVVSACNINRLLKKKGHDVSVFTVGDGPVNVDGYQVYRFRGVTFKPYPEYKFLLPNHLVWYSINQKELDVVHSRTPYPLGIVADKVAKKKRIPMVATFDTPLSDYIHYIPVFGSIWPTKQLLSSISTKHIKWYYNKACVITAPSETTKKYLLSIGITKSVKVISNGVDTKRFNPKKYDLNLKNKICPNGEKFLLHIGRITKEKDVEFLVKAVEPLLNGGGKIKLVIVGDGPLLPKIKAYVKSKNISKGIIFTGYLSQDEIPRYYASADAFVTASPVETQGIVLLESMASGTPVIGVSAGAVPELVSSRNGFLFDKGDVSGFENIVNDYSKKGSLTKACLKTIEKHTIESVADQVEQLYKDEINNYRN